MVRDTAYLAMGTSCSLVASWSQHFGRSCGALSFQKSRAARRPDPFLQIWPSLARRSIGGNQPQRSKRLNRLGRSQSGEHRGKELLRVERSRQHHQRLEVMMSLRLEGERPVDHENYGERKMCPAHPQDKSKPGPAG